MLLSVMPCKKKNLSLRQARLMQMTGEQLQQPSPFCRLVSFTLFAFACIVSNQRLTLHVVQHVMHKRLPVSGDGPNHIVNHLLSVL